MTYNVFSGTLNPTHFTSLHFTVQLSVVLVIPNVFDVVNKLVVCVLSFKVS